MATELSSIDPCADQTRLQEETMTVNEALVLGALHQHELTEAAENANARLQAEIADHQKTAQTLVKTARELAEKARLLDLSNDAIIVRGFDDKISVWNKGAEKLYGWTCDEVIGKDLHSLLRTQFPKPREEIVAQLHREGQFTGEVLQFARDGRPVTSLCRWVLDVETQSILTSYTDITERRTLEDALVARAEELAQADRSKDEFLAMLAHELRNPLSSVANAVALLKEVSRLPPAAGDAGDGKETQRQIQETNDTRWWATDVIDRQSQQLARLVEDLLDVSRITRGKAVLRPVPLDAATVLTRASETSAPLLAACGHTLLSDFPRGELWLEADPVRAEQIVVNLLNNAAKYTLPPGHIFLQAHRDGTEIVITVRDTGIGIPPERVPEMFELFKQGERSSARSEGGLGIGLTVVRSLCELHGGSVSAYSDGPGTGSTFTVRLPAIDSPKAAQSSAREIAVATGEGTGARILIVDDNVDSATGLRRLLARRGFVIVVAHDGLDALEKAREFVPAVVLLDLGLPGMDGYEVARRLRAEPCCADVLIIAITGYGQDEDLARSHAAGCDHHLVKPIDFGGLYDLLVSNR